MRLTKIQPAGALMVALDGRTPIEAIITSPSVVPAGVTMTSVPLVVAAEEVARKFTLPLRVADAAERNVGFADCAWAASGATQTAASSARLYRTAFMAPPPPER